jgi:orotate phosphoribosyltransferase
LHSEIRPIAIPDTGLIGTPASINAKEPAQTVAISGLRTVELDCQFFKDKYVIIFDDVVTSGGSMLRAKDRLEKLGAFVVSWMSVGKTV